MARRRHMRRLRCLVCAAGGGQLAPFCEWCGARHTELDGRLILTGAICQACGFQSRLPFAACPRCRAQARVECPDCGNEVALRHPCDRCGLHYAFFDQVRARRPEFQGSIHPAARKFVFAAGLLALAATLAPGHSPRGIGLCAAIAAIVVLPAALASRPSRRQRESLLEANGDAGRAQSPRDTTFRAGGVPLDPPEQSPPGRPRLLLVPPTAGRSTRQGNSA